MEPQVCLSLASHPDVMIAGHVTAVAWYYYYMM